MKTIWETRSAHTNEVLALNDHDPRTQGWALTTDFIVTEIPQRWYHITTESTLALQREGYNFNHN